MIARSVFIAIISLFIFSFPGYSLAAMDHSSHGGTPVSPAGGHDTHLSSGSESGTKNSTPLNTNIQGSGHDSHGSGSQHGTESASYDGSGSAGHSSDNSAHGEQGSGHGVSGKSSLEPAKNLLVGGFIGLNAFILAVAAYLKFRVQGGVAG